ncbi:MAG: tRNA pseudouridine(38-40) synthase TruA [Spirochaetales bacterium]|nr:tRNA pseudouridine(38-40) synthase TruA [Spirochaetales bacterium]
MSKRNIRLTISYDGTDFCGWQTQADQRTVQGELQNALFTMHKHPVTITGAGRTDTGVHANGQVANFFTDIDSIPDRQFRDAINYYLPQDVRVLESSLADDDFSARFSARKRMYRYFHYFSEVNLPHMNKYAVRLREKPDIRLLNEYASYLIGEHDFAAFAAAGDQSNSKTRIVYSSCFYMHNDFLVYKIMADSFLYRMVRSIVGTLLECEKKRKSGDEFAFILYSGDRKAVGCTAPARGLFLEKVLYDGND